MIRDYTVYLLKGRERLIFMAGAVLTYGGCGYLFYNHGIAALLFACLAWPTSRYYGKYKAHRRMSELSCQFRDLLYSLSSSMATGRHMREALKEAEGSMRLIYGEEALICRELENMMIRMEESGETEEAVLKDFAQRSGMEDVRNFSDIYSICRRTGGNMDRVIRKTVAILLYRIDLDREIRTLTAQKRMEFIILSAMPLAMLVFLRITSGSYLEIMYVTGGGRILMTGAFLAVAAAAVLGIRMTRISL